MIRPPVIALVTAYNEETTIGAVLRVLKNCPSVDRIQVVDDGSTDATANVAKDENVQVISLPKRIPVGEAIKHHTTNIPEKECTLLWCDADLINLQVHHIERILSNLRDNDVSMSVGLKDNIPFLPVHATSVLPMWFLRAWLKIFTRFHIHNTGGERAVHRSTFDEAMATSDMSNGYGIVILLNWYCDKYAKGYVTEMMPKLLHRNKYEKWGWKAAFEIPIEIFQFFTTYVLIRWTIRKSIKK